MEIMHSKFLEYAVKAFLLDHEWVIFSLYKGDIYVARKRKFKSGIKQISNKWLIPR